MSRIRDIRLTNFRNIGSVVLTDIGQRTVFWGDNGQGKTNLLEAIYLMLTGGSFRVRVDSELIMDGTDYAVVSGGLVVGDVVRQLSVRLSREGGKEVIIDDKKTQPSKLAAILPVVLFNPEEVDLIRTTTAARRRILDGLGMRLDAGYRSDLAEYIRVWRHRNQLLLAIKQRRAEEDELDGWDVQMAELGMRIMKYRKKLVSGWGEVAADKYKTFGLSKKSSLKVLYKPSVAAVTSTEYLEELRRSHQMDIIRTHTTIGIHRDDLAFVLDGENALLRASRGEFRSVVLSMKLAEGEIYRGEIGEPIYLFDDVWSELDEYRKSAIDSEVGGAQLFITTHEQGGDFRVVGGGIEQATVAA